MMTDKEDKNQDVAIAEISRDILYIKDSLKKIDDRLELMDKHYMRREELETMKEEFDHKHDDFEKRLRLLERETSVFMAQIKTYGAVAVIVLGVVQFLIGKFL